MKTTLLIFSTLTTIAGLTFSQHSWADSSSELSCRNKAKETAADVYKNCMTDLRQSQLEQIRKDYKEKLSELKSHYDNELKKISGKNHDQPSHNLEKSSDQLAAESSKVQPTKMSVKIRSSGARSLPAKKTAVNSKSIDLTTPSTTVDTEEDAIVSQSRIKNDTEGSKDVEVVELPAQE